MRQWPSHDGSSSVSVEPVHDEPQLRASRRLIDATEQSLSSRVRPMQLTRWLTFPDSKVEMEYRREVLKPVLERNFVRNGLIISLFILVQGGGFTTLDLLGGRRPGPAVWASVQLAIASLLTTAIALRLVRQKVALWKTEVLAMLFFLYIDAMAGIGGRGGAMRAMMSPMVPYLRTPTADELASDLAMTWSLQSTFLRVVMAIACFNAFGPMQLPAYAVSVGAMLGGQVVAAALAPPPGSDAGPLVLVLVDWAFLFIAAALLFFLRVQAILVERKTFHLQREVVALAQGEIAHRLREQTAVAVSTARSQLIRVVMHDLRSPLLAVSTGCGMLQAMPGQTCVESASVRECIAALASCSSLMERIVSDMLDFERIDSGRLVLVYRPFQLGALLNATRHVFALQAEQKGVRFQALLAKPPADGAPPDEPPAPALDSLGSAGWYMGDLERLQQCVNNGVSNALKFTERGRRVTVYAWEAEPASAQPGAVPACGSGGLGSLALPPWQRSTRSSGNTSGGSLNVTAALRRSANSSGGNFSVGAQRRPGAGASVAPVATPHARGSRMARIYVAVVDEGMGISAEELAVLSTGEPFTQVGKGQLQGSGGTGLGVGIARQILALHGGGALELSSAGLGLGSRYEMRLELAFATATDKAEARKLGATYLRTSLPPPAAARDARAARAAAAERARAPGAGGVDGSAAVARCGTCRGSFGPPAAAADAQQVLSQSPKELSELELAGAAGAPAVGSIELVEVESSAHSVSWRQPGAQLASLREPTTPQPQPQQQQPQQQQQQQQQQQLPSGAQADGALLRCLHVEDDQMLVYMLGATVLSAPGLAVAHAPNGSEALRAVAAAPPGAQFDLVLMDNQMPVLCGAQATRELRARGFAGLIVGMTGDPVGSEDRADFESSGLDLCVDKDVHGSNLVRDVIHKARDQGVASVRAERALEQARTAASSLLVVAATRGSR